MNTWSNKTDNEVIEGCLLHLPMAQRELFERNAPYSMSIILRYVKDAHYSEDVFLRGFEKAFNHLNSYDNNLSEFKYWLRKIMVNEALNYLRANQKLQLVNNIADYEFIDDGVNILDELETEDVLEMIHQLKPPYDLIFNMVVDGYKYKEIGDALKINEATCRSYYMRSRKMLIDIFEQYKRNYHANDVK